MRILISGPPPWAQSGYGVQTGIAAEALGALGHELAVSAYAGVHEERNWQGIPVMGTGGKAYGNGVIAGNYRRWRADLLIFMCDPWTIDPAQLAGLNVMPWMPVDCQPLSRMEQSWLGTASSVAASLRPVAMSQHGQHMLKAAGWESPLVPLAAQDVMRPDAEGGKSWREHMAIPEGAFVIGKIGVSNEDDRKCFSQTLAAFARFAARYRNAFLYLHCEAQAAKSVNLALTAMDLDLRGRVAFADEYRRSCDLYTAADMARIFNGLDVLDSATRAEGFAVPIIEALACGTPVIGCRNSAVTEKIHPDWGWLVSGNLERARHHQAWWSVPLVTDLARAYEKAAAGARMMRAAAALEGSLWSADAMLIAWERALSEGIPAHP